MDNPRLFLWIGLALLAWMNIIQWAMKVAEDVTGMPAMLQGSRGDSPDTLGGMEMAQNNSSSILRRIAKRMDDYVTGPHITRYYEWMRQHSKREDIKGDFNIEVRASSALVARDMQQMFLMQLLTVSRDPAYEISPKKLAEVTEESSSSVWDIRSAFSRPVATNSALRMTPESTLPAAAVEDEVARTRAVSYTHLRAHETPEHLVCRLLLEKKTTPTT